MPKHMDESVRKQDNEELVAQRLKAAITERGESALFEILAQVRSFQSGLSAYIGAQSGLETEAERGQDAAMRAEMRENEPADSARGVETVEYAPRLIMRTDDEGAEERGSPRERRNEVRERTAQRRGSALFGKSRSEQLDIIRRLSDEVSEELPERFYEKLNGGIALSDAVKYHPKSRTERPLLILGEYRNDPRIGMSIMLYGGSIIKTHAYLNEGALKAELRRIIRHEFTHHIESLCGERGLEIEDEVSLARYEWELTEHKNKAEACGEQDDCR